MKPKNYFKKLDFLQPCCYAEHRN